MVCKVLHIIEGIKIMPKYDIKHLATDPDITNYVRYIGVNSKRASQKLRGRFHELTRAESVAIIKYHARIFEPTID